VGRDPVPHRGVPKFLKSSFKLLWKKTWYGLSEVCPATASRMITMMVANFKSFWL
jgi:hypothetical protein